MPVHDWTRVDAGIFHHFHHSWIEEISRALNRGLLPPGHYAMAEQIAGGLGPDVLTLQAPTNGAPASGEITGGVAIATTPVQAYFHFKGEEADQYAKKAKAIVVRHTSGHRVVAVIEIVSPGNKSSRQGLRSFVQKAAELIGSGVHLLIVDLFPPGPRDPQGIHPAIWDEVYGGEFALPPDRPLTLAAYIGGGCPEALVEPFAVGQALRDWPLFLERGIYVLVPLEQTYQEAWTAVPAYWRNVLDKGA